MMKKLGIAVVGSVMALSACMMGTTDTSTTSSSSSSSGGTGEPDCTTTPANVTREMATEIASGAATNIVICPLTGANDSYWFKLNMAGAADDTYRVQLDFAKHEADVADADLGVWDATNMSFDVGSTTMGSCSNGSGSGENANDEDCNVQIDMAGDVYVEVEPFSGAPSNATLTVTKL